MGVYLSPCFANGEDKQLFACLITGANPAEAVELHKRLEIWEAVQGPAHERRWHEMRDGTVMEHSYLVHCLRQDADPQVDALHTWHMDGFGRVSDWWAQDIYDTVGHEVDPKEIDRILDCQDVTLPPLARELITELSWG